MGMEPLAEHMLAEFYGTSAIKTGARSAGRSLRMSTGSGGRPLPVRSADSARSPRNASKERNGILGEVRCSAARYTVSGLLVQPHLRVQSRQDTGH